MSLDIISSKVIGAGIDAFWSSALPKDLPQQPVTLLVVTQPYEAGGTDEQQLKKMLQACNLEANRLHILQLPAGETIAWHKLREALQPKVVMLLGTQPGALGIAAMLRPYAPQGFNDVTWIFAQDLPTLANQPEAKKQLWQNCLKPVFIDQAYGPLN